MGGLAMAAKVYHDHGSWLLRGSEQLHLLESLPGINMSIWGPPVKHFLEQPPTNYHFAVRRLAPT